jgi:hypothetical protein
MPALPKGVVTPTVVAGLYGVGRGQDRQALIEFFQTLAQNFGPESVAKYVNVPEGIKRLATSSGIDTAGLVKLPQQLKQDKDQAMSDSASMSMVNQAGQLAKSPMAEQMMEQMQGQQNGQQQEAPTPPPSPEG